MSSDKEYQLAKKIATKYHVSVGCMRLAGHYAEAVDKIDKSNPGFRKTTLDGNSGMTMRQIILKAEVEY